MSSAEEDVGDVKANTSTTKKRRFLRACDSCRRKKIRCDGSQVPGNKCSICTDYNIECQYLEHTKKRGPPKAYVETLESRLEKMERLLQRLCPEHAAIENHVLASPLGARHSSPSLASDNSPIPFPPPPSRLPLPLNGHRRRGSVGTVSSASGSSNERDAEDNSSFGFSRLRCAQSDAPTTLLSPTDTYLDASFDACPHP
ncbi:hypothetical protein BJV77DRAFT_287549 [Russula vinacea]|nr:hypothetical protein BJV77DRAFT_287549 [Russula vinacea]